MKHAGFFFRAMMVALLLMNAHEGSGQHRFQGVVTDAATGLPVEAATVLLLKGAGEALVSYTFTDAKGLFTLPGVQAADSMQIAVSLLGYKAWKEAALPGKPLSVCLEEQAFRLREVEIRPGRVWGQRDTIRYDVTQFLTARDETIRDVIKKLPGIDVDDLGQISYNGKSIRHFYVEGMDLTSGRYSQITNNLDAKAVESIQLLENHQPIRILQDKIKTDDMALNLTLKPAFRDKWMLTLRGAAGLPPFLWEASANAMQLSRKSQSAYLYKGDNTGKDVTDEQRRFFDNRQGKLPEPEAPAFLSQPSIMAPLKKERLLFNDVHTLSANRLYKLTETALLRLNAGYTHDTRRQERGSETIYFRPADSVSVAEQTSSLIRTRQGEVSIHFENNTPDYFMDNRLKATATQGRSLSLQTGNHPATQRIHTDDIGLRNDFRNLWNPAGYTLEARSLIRYTHSPARLTVNDRQMRYPLNQLYADHSFSVIRKKGAVHHHYSGGIAGQVSNIKNSLSLYALPSWQLNHPGGYATLSLPLIWTSFPGGDLSRIAANPSVSYNYKPGYAWRFSLYAGYREQYGDILNLRAAPYQTDYRHTVWNTGKLPIQRLQNYSAYAEYKRTVREFFTSLSLSHTRTWSDHIYEPLIEAGQLTLASRHLPNKGDSWSLQGAISKGFYNLRMKASLGYHLSRSQGEQLSQGERLPFTAASMQYEPKISWSPSSHIEASYQSTIRYGGSTIGHDTRLAPLWNMVQKATVSYDLFPFGIDLSAEHYYNDISPNKPVSVFFADLSFRLKHGDWQFEASATNLFDQQQYRYTEYTSLQSYTSRIFIRGRELLIAARYRF
jgi:hypothetical protein